MLGMAALMGLLIAMGVPFVAALTLQLGIKALSLLIGGHVAPEPQHACAYTPTAARQSGGTGV